MSGAGTSEGGNPAKTSSQHTAMQQTLGGPLWLCDNKTDPADSVKRLATMKTPLLPVFAFCLVGNLINLLRTMDNRVTHSRAKISLIDTATCLIFAKLSILTIQSTFKCLQYLEYLILAAQIDNRVTQFLAKIHLINIAASSIFEIFTTLQHKFDMHFIWK